jgi:aldose 1-epimerase
MDSHLTGWGGTAVLASAEARLTLAAEGAWARNAQLFVPRGAGVLCVEPVSHIPDAPNQPHFQRHGPMPPLAPGAVLEASLRLDCEG